VQPQCATVVDLSAVNVLAFLNDLERVRGNGSATRNARLAALRALARYILFLEPTLSSELQSLLALESKRTHRRVLGYLTNAEVDSVLNTPDSQTWSGRRDRVLFLTMYNSGARVSEIIAVRTSDVVIGKSSSLRLHGKGRKERVLPLWKNTASAVRTWLAQEAAGYDAFLFPNSRGRQLTRSGVAKRLSLAVHLASRSCPSLRSRRISPHILRHSIAMHMLEGGADITVIAMWLGHEHLDTTHLYVTSDLAMKQKTLDAVRPPSQRKGRFRPTDKVLEYLESL